MDELFLYCDDNFIGRFVVYDLFKGEMLGLALALAILVWMNLYNKKTQALIIVVLFSLCVLVVMKPEMLEKAFSMIGKIFYFNKASAMDSINIRMNLLKNGGVFLINTFGMGKWREMWNTGWPMHPFLYRRITTSTTEDGNLVRIWYNHIHFIYYVLCTAYRSCLIKYKNASTRIDKTVSLCFLCCLVGYVVGSLSSSSNISSEWLWVFWSIVIAYQGLEVEALQRREASALAAEIKNGRRIFGECSQKRHC